MMKFFYSIRWMLVFTLIYVLCPFLEVFSQTGHSISEPFVIDLPCERGYYEDIQNTNYFENNYNNLYDYSPDVWYRFTVTNTSLVEIKLCESDFDTYVHLLNTFGTPIYDNDDDGPSCEGTRSSIIETLLPGTYYIVVEGYGDASGNMKLEVNIHNSGIIPIGATLGDPIIAGSFGVNGGSFTDSRVNVECMGNEIGQPSNDIFYKFSLDVSSQVVLSHCGSNINTYMHLLNSSGGIIQSNDDSSDSPCSGLQSYISTTLSPGVYYVVSEGYGTSMGKITTIIAIEPVAPNWDRNYISTYTPINSGMTTGTMVTTNSTDPAKVQLAVQYFDGLGRPIQTVQSMGSPDGEKDIVQAVVYDDLGRESKKYLPYAVMGHHGTYRINALAPYLGVSAFYATAPVSITSTAYPYMETRFENSPLQRVFEQGATGASWQLSAGHTVKIEYGRNTATEVRLFEAVLSTTPTQEYKRILQLNSGSGYYGIRQLYKVITKDENWTSSQTFLKAGTVEEFKDKEGRVILKRSYNVVKNSSNIDELQTSSTYYVYDDFGNLCYVLPPGADPDAGLPDATQLNNYCYQYYYDDQNRLIEKKIPGKGWEYIVYNKLDQVVATQDAVQRLKTNPEWSFTKYDALGRPIMSGYYSNGEFDPVTIKTRSQLQALVDGYTGSASESRNNIVPLGYTNDVYVGDDDQNYVMLNVNYYDDYDFPGGDTYPFSGKSNMTKGLQTGSLINILGTDDKLLSLTYYDNKGRVAKTFGQHYLSGAINITNYDEITNEWNFDNSLKSTSRNHHVGIKSTPIVTNYSYDHMGRKLETKQSINGATPTVISKLSYNELGILKKKELQVTEGAEAHVSLDGDDVVLSGNNVSVKATESITMLQDFQAVYGSVFSASIVSNGNLQEVNYTYNERGWLKSINSSLFSETLKYDDGTIPQYNGNIANQVYANGGNSQTFNYSYDKLNRLILGQVSSSVLSEALSYDVMGNIKTLSRDGLTAGTYNYTGNRLNNITGGTLATGTYLYDENGNATFDGRNSKTISYNMLNLPETVSGNLNYTYDAMGRKLSKNSNGTIRNYIDGIEYNGTTIDIIQTEEGIARNNAGTYSYEYNLTDHLGNVRTTFYKNPGSGALDILQRDDYYAFGKRKSVPNGTGAYSVGNKYLYNGKEIQDELGGQFDYGARFYDAEIGRWGRLDNMSELYFSNSTYGFSLNNPINAIDPDGNVVIFINGNHFGEGATGYYATYDQNKGNYDFYGTRDYWTNGKLNFDYKVQNQLNDHSKAIYRDGGIGGWFGLNSLGLVSGKYDPNSSSDRKEIGYNQGMKDATTIVGNLARNTSGEIIESIKIITHSMGGAYGKGYVKALQNYISTLPKKLQSQIKISLIADFDPYQAGSLNADPNIRNMQFMHEDNWNLFGMGWLANEIEMGMDPNDLRTNTGNSSDHSIFTFFNDISSLQEGTYKWDGNQWVKQ